MRSNEIKSRRLSVILKCFCVLTAGIAVSCTRMTEPPQSPLYTLVETWGKDDGGSSGPGHGDGTSGTAPGAFNDPVKAVIWNDSILILDAGNHRIQKLSLEGFPESFEDQTEAWGNSLGSEGVGPGEFISPSDLACDVSGNIFVCDAENMSVHVFLSTGTFRTQLGRMRSGTPYPTNAPGGYIRPAALAVDSVGRLYVADTARSAIDRYTPALLLDASWGVGGSLVRQEFSRIRAIACLDDELFLLEKSGIRVCGQNEGSERAILDGFGYSSGRLSSASGFSVDEEGILVSDGSFIRLFDKDLDYSGYFCGTAGSKPGEIISPAGLAVFGKKVYLCDSGNNRIQVFKSR